MFVSTGVGKSLGVHRSIRVDRVVQELHAQKVAIGDLGSCDNVD